MTLRLRLLMLFAALLVAAEADAARGPDGGSTSEATLIGRSAAPRVAARRRRGRRPAVRPVRPKKAQPPVVTDEGGDKPAPSGKETPPAPAGDQGALRRGARVEFDGRLVQGQTAKSGAIYLFARKRSQVRSMVKERTEYRKEILRTVYPDYRAE